MRGPYPLIGCSRHVLFPGVPSLQMVVRPADVSSLYQAINEDCLVGVYGYRATGRPVALPPILCLAKIRRLHPLPNGGLIVRWLGLARARLVRELHTEKSHRRAELEPVAGITREPAPAWLARAERLIHQLRGSGPADDPHALWLDLLCHCLPLTWEAKQELLEETLLENRYAVLTRRLSGLQTTDEIIGCFESLETSLPRSLLPRWGQPN